MTESKWGIERKNILAMYEKFPARIVDCIDAAYLAGLEANQSGDIAPINNKARAEKSGLLSSDWGKKFDLAEQLHNWYLEAVVNLSPGDFNPDANKPYSQLTDEQKYLDKYIAAKVSYLLAEQAREIIEEIPDSMYSNAENINKALPELKQQLKDKYL